MKNKNKFLILNLQLFAEGGAGEGGTSAGGAMADSGLATAKPGVKSNPLANVKYGIQDNAQTTDVQNGVVTDDRNAKFESLIKGEFKDLYDAKVQDTIKKRLKSSTETVERYNSLLPTLELLAKKYGVSTDDITSLNKAIEEDDSFFEEEALERGISVEQLKEIRKMERENADLKRQMQEQETQKEASRMYASWMEQAESTKSVYPSFDLNSELQNPKFVDLLRNNIDVRTAYEVIHKDDIIRGAMHFTAQQVEKKVTDRVIANGARPAENGMNSQAAPITKSDVSQLSKADRAEIIRRVQRGEKIRF